MTASALHPSPATTRHDIYKFPHKGLRLGLSNMMARIGATDFADEQAVGKLAADLRDLVDLAEGHVMLEDANLHPAMDEREPGLSGRLAADHAEHRESFAELRALADALETAAPEERSALGHRLYLRFSVYVGDEMEHMATEERSVLPRLHELFTDAELMDVEGRMIGSIPPPKMMRYLRWMAPALNPDERVILVGKLQAKAPPEAFQAILANAVRPNLGAEDWARLAARLGVPA